MRLKLDFECYTRIEHGYLIIPSPPSQLTDFPDLYDRICGTIYMAAKVGGDSDKSFISKKAKDASFIRASLCEFVSIEEYIKQTYPKLEAGCYRLYKSSNPIFHMLKLLRNYNIHIEESVLDNKSMMVEVPKYKTEQFEIEVEFISNLSVAQLKNLSSAKDYSDELLEKMINCFEVEQHQFGVPTLIIKSALDYADKLLTLLCPEPK